MRHAGIQTAAALFAAFMLLPGAAGAASERAQLKGALAPTGADPDASGTVVLKLGQKGASLDLKLSGLEPETEYQIEISGIPEASFVSKRSGKASVKFRKRPKGPQAALDFDPRGKALAVTTEGGAVLTGDLTPASIGGGATSDELVRIRSTSLAVGANVFARYRVRKDGRRDFSVEAQRLPAGAYELYVGGILRGALVTAGAKGKGEIEFRDPLGDDIGKFPLDFDPTGQEITVARGDAIFASGPFVASIPGVNQCTPSTLLLSLAPQAGAPGGTAKATIATTASCRQKLEVELESVPAGDYDLFVGGVLRGAIHVASAAETHGEIEFETQGGDDDPNESELPLDFSLTDVAVEIAQGAMVLFAGNTANASAAGPSACTEPPSEVQVSLLNSGADADAKGKARFRVRDDCESDFRVEIENLPVGSYDLLVGGVVRGAIDVQLVGGELVGEIEFDTDPSGGEVQLDFDPRGQLVEVDRETTLYLSRELPTAE